jgi:hypothetical protein
LVRRARSQSDGMNCRTLNYISENYLVVMLAEQPGNFQPDSTGSSGNKIVFSEVFIV